MPYIITTAGRLADGRLHQWSDPIAVATLDEARWSAVRAVRKADYADPSAFAEDKTSALNLPESGGTVGPLPDGTIIEVRRVTEAYLRDAMPTDSWGAQAATTRDVLTAFNAQQ